MAKLVIWDLDGTLVNSLPATLEAFNDGIEAFLGRRLPHDEIMAHFGRKEQEILGRLVGEHNAAACYRKAFESMQARMNLVAIFPGILQTLHELARLSLPLAIFTGRGRHGTDFLLDELKLASHFATVVTQDDVRHPKPHPEGIYKVCETLGVAPADALMVGDTIADVGAARQAGARSVACLWDRLAREEELRAHAPDLVIRTPDELLTWISRY